MSSAESILMEAKQQSDSLRVRISALEPDDRKDLSEAAGIEVAEQLYYSLALIVGVKQNR